MTFRVRAAATSVHPWRPDLLLGAVRSDEALLISLSADEAWSGELRFDRPRHRTYMKMPLDWPRMNQFPEWFTVDAGATYAVREVGAGEGPEAEYSGAELLEGMRCGWGRGRSGA